jgi:hypothetical protein
LTSGSPLKNTTLKAKKKDRLSKDLWPAGTSGDLALHVPASTLSCWEKAFYENMKALTVPDNQSKSGRVTTEMVRQIIEKAKNHKALGKRIRIKKFAVCFKNEDITLSDK